MRLRSIVRVLVYPKSTAEEMARLQQHVAKISEERDKLKQILREAGPFYPPGHFYSPVPSWRDIEEHLAKFEKKSLIEEIPAVQMDDRSQLDFLECLKAHYPKIPFRSDAVDGLLYQFDNPHFSYADGTILFCVLNHLRPRRLIEVGSGHSTCAILDTNRVFLNSQTQITSIEPYPQLLHSLIEKSHDKITIIESKLQDTDLAVFDQLTAGDILFIDSTHLAKVGSDVNCIFFEVLPRIKPGVIIHIHDIFAAFEYPDVWLREGRAWNESYLLRAFLQYNRHFRILLFVSYMQNAHPDWFRKHMPDTALKKGGSFWMEKL